MKGWRRQMVSRIRASKNTKETMPLVSTIVTCFAVLLVAIPHNVYYAIKLQIFVSMATPLIRIFVFMWTVEGNDCTECSHTTPTNDELALDKKKL